MTYFPKFNVDGMMRGDTLSRMNSYAVGINNGIYSVDEVRRLRDLFGDSDRVGGVAVDAEGVGGDPDRGAVDGGDGVAVGDPQAAFRDFFRGVQDRSGVAARHQGAFGGVGAVRERFADYA